MTSGNGGMVTDDAITDTVHAWHFREMVESMRDVAWIIDAHTLRFLYVSPSVEALRGYTPAEVMAAPLDAALTPEAAAFVRQLNDERLSALENGTASHDEFITQEIEQPCKDGSTVWTEVITRYIRDDATGRVEVFGVTRNITARRAALAALAESERHYRLLANNTSEIVTWVGSDGTYKWVSPSITEALGWAPEDWVGLAAIDNAHPDDRERFHQQRQEMTAGRIALDHGAWVDRFRAMDKAGRYHWVETRTRAYVDDDGQRDGAVVSFHVIDSLIESELELHRRANYDDLTGALKRDGAIERLDGIGREQRSAGSLSAVLFIDVDGLKKINDTRGHLAGDALLSALGARFTGAVRTGDSVARVGGDEFLIILEGLHRVEEAVLVAEKVRDRATAPVSFEDIELSTSASIGVTIINSAESADEIIARADAAMYASKRAGGNMIVVVPAPEVPSK